MIPGLPSESTAIVYGIVAIIGIIFLVVARRYLLPWVQKYQTTKDAAKQQSDTEMVQKANVDENTESDALAKIDDRN